MTVTIDGDTVKNISMNGEDIDVVTADNDIVFNQTTPPYLAVARGPYTYLYDVNEDFEIFRNDSNDKAVALNSNYIAYTKNLDDIYVADIKTGKTEFVIDAGTAASDFPDGITDIDMTDNYMIYTAPQSSETGKIVFYDLSTQTEIRTHTFSSKINAVAVDGEAYAAVSSNSQGNIYNADGSTDSTIGTSAPTLYDIDLYYDSNTGDIQYIICGDEIISGPSFVVDFESGDFLSLGCGINSQYYAYTKRGDDIIKVKEKETFNTVATFNDENPGHLELTESYLTYYSDAFSEIFVKETNNFNKILSFQEFLSAVPSQSIALVE